jgi:hypothetical protein
MTSHTRSDALYNIIAVFSVYEAFLTARSLRADAELDPIDLDERFKTLGGLLESLSGEELGILLADPAVILVLVRWYPERFRFWLNRVPSNRKAAAHQALVAAADSLSALLEHSIER